MSARPSEPGELVTVTIDGVSVQVPRGAGVVEAALAAGIEIPVFCYEPRLGAPVGACRMCLCEFEGLPKLQAACTMTATEGMVVRTAATSPKAAEGQESVLEFILVNHPLDCPICDKGGECPLQDLTFRWGPANTRMTFPKRTLEKPIPVSPLIALDRERCILCYRCTRFSEGVAEDGQLVAKNRGASSVIATFDGQPYRAPFSGNVVELCPVGALTSTQYRFEARPWEIQNVPSVCTLCPVGCNIQVTTREGKVKRVLSRNHPEVDEGWLCDKGRSSFPYLYAEDRLVDPLLRTGRRLEEASWEDAVAELVRLGRAAQGRALLALSGTETLELAYALSKLVRVGLGSNAVVLPEPPSGLGGLRAPLSAIAAADVVVVLGDEPAAERAPIVDLWLRAARRRGAVVTTIGPDGDVQTPPGTAAETARRLAAPDDELGGTLRSAARAVLVWSGPGGAGGTHVAALAREVGAAAAFHLPATPNGTGVAEAWAAAGEGPSGTPEQLGLLIVSGDEAAGDPQVRALADRAEHVVAISMFRRSTQGGWADLILPGTSYLERDGTTMNLEGRLQRLRRAVIPPAPDELAWLARAGAELGVPLSPYPAKVFEELSARAFGGVSYGQVGEQAELPRRADEPRAAPTTPRAEPARTSGGGPLQLIRYRPLFSGVAVARVAELEFQRPQAEVELSPVDARVRGIAPGDPVMVSSNGTSVELRARINARLVAGAVRAAEEHVAGLAGGVELTHAERGREAL
jgi:NADH-quinone oxidoreductase subunit G